MRILVAQDSIDAAGGVGTYLDAVVPALRARGHYVSLLYHHRAQRGVSSIEPYDAALGVEMDGLETAFARIHTMRPDVCFSHNMAPLEIDRLLLRDWPVVKMMHGYFGTCISGLKMHAFPVQRACDRVFGASCLALYGPRRCGHVDPRRALRDYRWSASQHRLLNQYSAVVVASHHMGREFERHGVERSRMTVLPLFPTISSAAPCSADARCDAVLFAGRMTKLKGGHLLIAAAAEARRQLGKPIRLVMAGDGPQSIEWRRLATHLDVPAEFPGWVRGTARVDLFSRAAVLAVPSVWPEPFGLVGLEAASFGVPAVAFDVGGIRTWLEPGTSGIVVRPSEGAAGFARALVAILSDNHERERLGAGAFDIACRLSLPTHVDQLELVLRNAAGH